MTPKCLDAKNALHDACAIHTAQQAHQCLSVLVTNAPHNILFCLPTYQDDCSILYHVITSCGLVLGRHLSFATPQSSTSLVLGRQLSFTHYVEIFLERPVAEPGIQDVLCALHRHRAANQSASLPQTHN